MSPPSPPTLISPRTDTRPSKVIFDTGSFGLLIPSKICPNCNKTDVFDPTKSTTFSHLPGLEINPLFGTAGDTVPIDVPEGANCTAVTDTVRIGTAAAPAKEFLLCDSYGPGLAAQPPDGLFGLGSTATASWDGIHFFDTIYQAMVSSGQLPSPVFGYHMIPGQKYGSQLTFGGVDKSRSKGPTRTIRVDRPLSELRRTWIMDVVSIAVKGGRPAPSPPINGSSMGVPGVGLVDSATSYMIVPDLATAQDLYGRMSPLIVPIDNKGSWGAPCATLNSLVKDVSFRIGKAGQMDGVIEITVPKEFMNLGPYAGLPGICQALFANPPGLAREPLQRRPGWVFGGPTIKAYYTTWNYVDMTLGFAKAKDH